MQRTPASVGVRCVLGWRRTPAFGTPLDNGDEAVPVVHVGERRCEGIPL